MNLKTNIPLLDFSSFKIGGPAEYFFEVHTREELEEALHLAQRLQLFVLGQGTNVLINDKGFLGLVIHNKLNGIKKQGNSLIVGSGVLVSDILDFCIESSFSGLEWAGGLPGTIGGAVRGNAGAFGGEIKDSVISISSLNIKTLSERTRSNKECKFAYRNSVFKSGGGKEEFIASVILNLKPGNKTKIQKLIAEKIDYRNLKHPMDYPNIGSIFKNIPLGKIPQRWKKEFGGFIKTDPFPIVPTAKLLALAGLKGVKVGGAMISDKHPNFIVNADKASAKDVKNLIQIAKNAIKEKYGIILEEEIVYLG